MKIIFLDFDGVIVTRKTRYQTGDSSCIAALNHITDQTGALIVVSSCWRIGREVIELREQLSGWGVTGKVLDRTPHDWNLDRGAEIQMWIDSYQREDITHSVILDDDSDVRHLMPKLIQTNTEFGLAMEDAEKAIQLLNN